MFRSRMFPQMTPWQQITTPDCASAWSAGVVSRMMCRNVGFSHSAASDLDYSRPGNSLVPSYVSLSSAITSQSPEYYPTSPLYSPTSPDYAIESGYSSG